MADRYDTILVVDLLGGIGDLVMVLPAVHALARRHPDAFLQVLTYEPGASLLHEDPAVDEVLVPEGPGAQAAGEAVAKALESRPPDLAVTTTRYDDIPDLLQDGAERAVTDLWRNPPADQPVSERYLEILHTEGLVSADDLATEPALHVPDEHVARGRGLLGTLLPRGRPPVAFVPAAGMPVKQWPLGHWRRLADMLARDGVALCTLTALRDVPATPVPAMTLPRLAGFFAALHEAGGVVVGGDTGPVRVAAAAGAATVALFGPTAAGRYGVGGAADVQGLAECPHRRPTAITEQVCWWTAECPLSPVGPACMADIAPEQVYRAVAEAGSARRRRTARNLSGA